MRFIIPGILVAAAIGVYFFFMDPLYQDVQRIQARITELDEALESSKQVLALRDELLDTYNSIPEENLERVRKLLPDHVDNVRLILEIANLAEEHSLILQDVSLRSTPRNRNIGPTNDPFGSVQLEFRVEGTYPFFRAFVEDIEESLRLVDVIGMTFQASPTQEDRFIVAIQTYWLEE